MFGRERPGADLKFEDCQRFKHELNTPKLCHTPSLKSCDKRILKVGATSTWSQMLKLSDT